MSFWVVYGLDIPIRTCRFSSTYLEARLETECIQVQVWGSLQKIVSKVIVLAGSCDLPAKSLVLNFRQFNGFMGCPKCLQPGATLTLGCRSHSHVYPYISENPSEPLRTRNQSARDVKSWLPGDRFNHKWHSWSIMVWLFELLWSCKGDCSGLHALLPARCNSLVSQLLAKPWESLKSL